MITLIRVQVHKYKSIDNSTPVAINDDVTVLVGKNESGKTAFLEALHKALPLGDEKFNYIFDYPKREYVRYRPRHEAKDYANVVELTFRIEKELSDKINKEVFHDQKIVAPGLTFTRTTNYGNSSSIGFHVDQKVALTALKTPLAGVQYSDEVFDVDRLEIALKTIEEKNLPAEHSLVSFAAEWKKRYAKSAANWDMVGWHIWNTYLSKALPKCLYFDDYNLLDGKINLPSLHQRQTNNQLTNSDKTVLGLFDLAGITLAELMSEEGYETSKAKLEAIGLEITQGVFKYWKQNQELAVEFDIKTDSTDAVPFNNGKNLYIRIKNLRHGVTVPFDQRSKGFIWFFSFMAWFSSIQRRVNTNADLILLLDEPGLSLHALAQADFLSYIATLSDTQQIIYTTHSPFMVDSERLDEVRVVEDRAKDGTTVTENLEASADDSLFPLQAALGYSIAQNLFISKKNVLIEGPADLILLQHMSSLRQESGKPGLAAGTLVPVGGLDKLATFIALLGASKLKLVVLHDRASSSHQKLEDVVRNKLIERKRVLDFSMFREPAGQETDVEDLFPPELYLAAFNAAYSKELGQKKALLPGLLQHPRIVERINQWLATENILLLKDGGFNHYRVARSLVPLLDTHTVGDDLGKRFDALFERLQGALG